MIKSELVLKLAEQNPHLYQRDIEKVVNAILDTIVDALAQGGRVELRGFGTFAVKKRALVLGAILVPANPFKSRRSSCLSSKRERRCDSASISHRKSGSRSEASQMPLTLGAT